MFTLQAISAVKYVDHGYVVVETRLPNYWKHHNGCASSLSVHYKCKSHTK